MGREDKLIGSHCRRWMSRKEEEQNGEAGAKSHPPEYREERERR